MIIASQLTGSSPMAASDFAQTLSNLAQVKLISNLPWYGGQLMATSDFAQTFSNLAQVILIYDLPWYGNQLIITDLSPMHGSIKLCSNCFQFSSSKLKLIYNLPWYGRADMGLSPIAVSLF